MCTIYNVLLTCLSMNEKRCIHGTKGTKSKETDEAKLSHTVPIVQSIGPGLGKGQGQDNQTTVEVNGCILYLY